MDQTMHDALIIDQFTQQAVPFADKHRVDQDAVLQLILDTTGVTTQDTVLDVACGPGLLACALAERAQHVTGIDITPAMIERAKELQQAKGLTNLIWDVGTVLPLPYADATFSLVITRYSLHHFLDHQAVLTEMVRVGRRGGTIAVIDVVPASDKAAAYNHMEQLRDPSHVRALTEAELLALVQSSGVTHVKTAAYQWTVEVERQMQASFPRPGVEAQLRELFLHDLAHDTLGVGTHRRGDALYMSYPTLMVVGRRPADQSGRRS